VIWLVGSPPWNLRGRDWIVGIAVGLMMAIGTLALFAAMRRGKASIVTPLAALYPLVTVILAVAFLNEHLNLTKIAGIAIALIAAMALSIEDEVQSATVPSPSPGQ